MVECAHPRNPRHLRLILPPKSWFRVSCVFRGSLFSGGSSPVLRSDFVCASVILLRADTESQKPPATEPVFNTFRRKPLRSFYSLREIQIGFVILLILGGVLAWVLHRGANPDPNLFAFKDSLLTNKGKDVPVYKRPVEPWVEPGSVRAGGAGKPADLGPFPEGVVSEGWRVAKPPEMFDESNLYIKIDGREGFYKSYGFKKLHCLALVSTTKPDLSIDIELFDLGNLQNALGAFSAEISDPATTVTAQPGGLSYLTRNGCCLAQGPFYARIIGSDDQELIRQKVATLRDAFIAALPRETMPWAYELFVGGLKLSPAVIQYQHEDAFSYGFATDFYSATVGKEDTEVFVSRRKSINEALDLAAKLAEGFAGNGRKLPSAKDVVLVQNDYAKAVDAVRAHGVFVTGVRLAKTAEEATQWLERLTSELDKRPNLQEGGPAPAAEAPKAGGYE